MAFWLLPIRSTLACKRWLALTGAGLILFLLVHLAGNLMIFLGPDAINGLAQVHKSSPLLVWAVRLGLLAVFVLHLLLAIRLSLINQAARVTPYLFEDTRVASWAGRSMFGTGVVVLLFLLFHLAHFSFGWLQPIEQRGRSMSLLQLQQAYDPQTGRGLTSGQLAVLDGEPAYRQNLYAGMVVSFRQPHLVAIYLAALLALALHLWHGGSSLWQSLGLGTPRANRWVGVCGPLLTLVIVGGNVFLIIAIAFRWVGETP